MEPKRRSAGRVQPYHHPQRIHSARSRHFDTQCDGVHQHRRRPDHPLLHREWTARSVADARRRRSLHQQLQQQPPHLRQGRREHPRHHLVRRGQRLSRKLLGGFRRVRGGAALRLRRGAEGELLLGCDQHGMEDRSLLPGGIKKRQPDLHEQQVDHLLLGDDRRRRQRHHLRRRLRGADRKPSGGSSGGDVHPLSRGGDRRLRRRKRSLPHQLRMGQPVLVHPLVQSRRDAGRRALSFRLRSLHRVRRDLHRHRRPRLRHRHDGPRLRTGAEHEGEQHGRLRRRGRGQGGENIAEHRIVGRHHRPGFQHDGDGGQHLSGVLCRKLRRQYRLREFRRRADRQFVEVLQLLHGFVPSRRAFLFGGPCAALRRELLRRRRLLRRSGGGARRDARRARQCGPTRRFRDLRRFFRLQFLRHRRRRHDRPRRPFAGRRRRLFAGRP